MKCTNINTFEFYTVDLPAHRHHEDVGARLAGVDGLSDGVLLVNVGVAVSDDEGVVRGVVPVPGLWVKDPFPHQFEG